ncbi:SCO family protein [Crenothrix sp.]|uniref:SCO family protein n=1 Tax=Crenothrix sp. TaxID=3100433 RepID=UPI00374C91E4
MKTHSVMGYWRKWLIFTVFISAIVFGGSPSWAAPEGSPWNGDYFTNTKLVDQDGKTVHFYDDLIKGKIVVINFIFTHCGDSCPLETASLLRVQRLLAERMGKDIFFYSISIDPDHDTPKALKNYADNFGIGAGWRFLTGSKADTTLLRKKLGLFRDSVEASKLSDHNTSIMIGNESTGQWMKRSPFDEPKVLAWQLGYALSNTKAVHNTVQTGYAAADKLPKISKGADLFRFRCAACHSLGNEDGLGPGLQGITERRDKAWLARWIKTPDKLLAEKDPIAVSLYKRYNHILMPNLRLNDSDVEALINYMEEMGKSGQQVLSLSGKKS